MIASSAGNPPGQTFSADDGRTWSALVSIPPLSVEPSLAVLRGGGVVALSGGRPGIQVYFNADGKGSDWQLVDIAAATKRRPPGILLWEKDSPSAQSGIRNPPGVQDKILGERKAPLPVLGTGRATNGSPRCPQRGEPRILSCTHANASNRLLCRPEWGALGFASIRACPP